MPPRKCIDCRRNAVPGGSRCERHGGNASGWARYKANNPARASNYSSPAWSRLRDQVLREEPTCRRCPAPSTDVDHITPEVDGGRFFDRENLQGLCRSCHLKKTSEDNARRRRKAEE